jgi:lipopolysaccharide export system protein LptA
MTADRWPGMRRLQVLAVLLAIAAGVCLHRPAAAQGLSLGSGKQPVEILADQGIEWYREEQRYVARGNASAKQGETTVYGDVLTAYYRPNPDGGTSIFRYESEGNVRIVTPTQTAVGDKGVYDVDTGVLVLTGNGLKLTTPNEVVTARDSLEYWEGKQVAVARGDAVVVTTDRRMTGDILTAYFLDNKTNPAPPTAQRNPNPGSRAPAKGQPATSGRGTTAASTQPQEGNRLQRIEGFGNVLVSTATDIVRADRGVYKADTGIALMSERVRITRGQNQLDGDFAEVNLNTGLSRLLTRPDGDGKAAQVRGVFVPQQADSSKPNDDVTLKLRRSGTPSPNRPASQ